MTEDLQRTSTHHTSGFLLRGHLYFLCPFLEMEMSNSQTSAMAGKTQRGEKPPGEQRPGLPEGPAELETWRWHLAPCPVSWKISSCPQGGVWNPSALLGTVSHRSYFRHLP